MQNIIILMTFIFFSFACQTSSQDNEENKLISDSLKSSDEVKTVYRADTSDVAIYEKLIKYADDNQLENKSVAEIEIAVASQLMGTPYVGHTLENDSVESLVVNLRELDCTTFVENVSAISLCIAHKTKSFNDYCEMLTNIRYRDGKINQYPSRLHYSTDWMINNRGKGLLKIVSDDFGPADFNSKVDFMSTHPEYYRQLLNQDFVEEIRKHEARISEAKLKFIPKDRIDELAENIKDGDIIAISTTVQGLDFSHMALAAWKNNKLHFIHASSKEKKVVFSEKTLQEYLAGSKSNDGIVVARLNY